MKSFLNFLLFFIGTLYLKQVAFYKPQATCKAYMDKADSFLSQSAAMSF